MSPVQLVRVGSDSMTPALHSGDLVVVEPLADPPRHGDVVTIRHPDDGDRLIKRIVAVGGEEVAVEDGVLVVDGRRVCERLVDPERQDGVWFGPITVPTGAVFLLGDDRGSSIDSREFGAVDETDIGGRVRLRIWPSPGPLPAADC